jgi:hypothetical protein
VDFSARRVVLARAFVDRAHRLEELPSRRLGAVVGVVVRRLREQDVKNLPIAALFLQKHQSNIDVFRIPLLPTGVWASISALLLSE